jgi:hypothetical protein
MGDQPFARPLPIQTQNKHRQTSIPWVGFEPTMRAFKRTKTFHALDRAATVTGEIAVISFVRNNWGTCFAYNTHRPESLAVTVSRPEIEEWTSPKEQTVLHKKILISLSAGKHIHSLLWNLNINYRVNKNPWLVPVLTQLNPIHTLKHYFLKNDCF